MGARRFGPAAPPPGQIRPAKCSCPESLPAESAGPRPPTAPPRHPFAAPLRRPAAPAETRIPAVFRSAE
ncbi:hypothetical protein SU48_04300 [Deinococcus puniceus]|uniref:Uncharacterized protein n=1 Tax=Deinococcus puniceus TaxID=1182568 RepID=A0A172T839_9DEIO|nr:hypothetical protein SU48_04300 [Deinococcus puniceus]